MSLPLQRSEVLARIRPTDAARADLDSTVERLLDGARKSLAAQGVAGEPTVQGSIAKGTWLAGNADVDAFVLLDPSVPEADLESIVGRVAQDVLTDPRTKYAQHPYHIGTFEGLDVDLVPAYKVPDAHAKMSAVDRTPFHTAWVRSALDAATGDPGLRDEVLLAKRWCKNMEVYGAETAIGGFSGYLVEVLTIHFGGFDGFLDWLRRDGHPRRIVPRAPGQAPHAPQEDQVDDDVSTLIVVDPVDPIRNAAAAVQDDTLARATDAARAHEDTAAFWDTPAPTAAPVDVLAHALADQGATWLGLSLHSPAERLDIVFPQFQRSARVLCDALAKAGFPVRRHDVRMDEDRGWVGLQWIVDDVQLPPTRKHQGPPPDKQPNAERFLAKWTDHADLLEGPLVEDGRLTMVVRVHDRTARAFLADHLARGSWPKHVANALKGHALLDASTLDAVADVHSPWAPRVTDLVLDRRPWQRA